MCVAGVVGGCFVTFVIGDGQGDEGLSPLYPLLLLTSYQYFLRVTEVTGVVVFTRIKASLRARCVLVGGKQGKQGKQGG